MRHPHSRLDVCPGRAVARPALGVIPGSVPDHGIIKRKWYTGKRRRETKDWRRFLLLLKEEAKFLLPSICSSYLSLCFFMFFYDYSAVPEEREKDLSQWPIVFFKYWFVVYTDRVLSRWSYDELFSPAEDGSICYVSFFVLPIDLSGALRAGAPPPSISPCLCDWFDIYYLTEAVDAHVQASGLAAGAVVDPGRVLDDERRIGRSAGERTRCPGVRVRYPSVKFTLEINLKKRKEKQFDLTNSRETQT